MPPVFGIERERISRTDATFRSLFANPKAKIVQTEDLLASMDQAGIDMSVCKGFGWTDPGVARESNDYNLAAARSHPDRLVAFCSVNPLWGEDAVAEVHRCYEA
ncbi:MAG: amidohydrolase family protein, partial [Chloroflexi bacterium]|nr:amidohydrolase family protein [Chloroflexota bacterium]